MNPLLLPTRIRWGLYTYQCGGKAFIMEYTDDTPCNVFMQFDPLAEDEDIGSLDEASRDGLRFYSSLATHGIAVTFMNPVLSENDYAKIKHICRLRVNENTELSIQFKGILNVIETYIPCVTDSFDVIKAKCEAMAQVEFTRYVREAQCLLVDEEKK